MSLKHIHLRKLLQLIYLPGQKRKTALRGEIRADIQRESGGGNHGGGDFFVPFWADARSHVTNKQDLQLSTKIRIENNKNRERLYPLLAMGFLKWWDEKRRWINEPYEYLPENIKAQYKISELDCVIKVENLISVKLGNGSHRLIYPYFSEAPPLTEEPVRLALYILQNALPNYSLNDMRILNILRSSSFSMTDIPLIGDESTIFTSRYNALKAEWEKLREDYF